MADHVVLLSIPGLRAQDLAQMPSLARLAGQGDQIDLVPSFPCVTCPVQANMTTGKLPNEHGVVANGFYWRDKQQVEMWTAWNECIQAEQIWDTLKRHDPSITTAVWFALHSKGCGADLVCTPAPIHNPDGSETLWCYTKPTEMYGQLRDELGHFPLQHFWGPLSNIRSTAWICNSAVVAARQSKPNFFYLYLPHLDYAAQKFGPDSPQAIQALKDLDGAIERLTSGLEEAYAPNKPLWIVASEYTIVPVNHVVYPNRLLREAGLLAIMDDSGTEQLDFGGSRAWALVDHQLAHVFVAAEADIETVAELFSGCEGIDEVLVGSQRDRYALDHERSGEVILISAANSWQAYYWWLADEHAPTYAHTVDIHRKPGYDPVEMHLDMATKSIPLDATLVKGSHGAPPHVDEQRGVIIASEKGVLVGSAMADTDVCELVLRQFGI